MSEAEAPDDTGKTPRRPSKVAKASEEKWGAAVMKLGFCIVPSLLLRAQRRLKLNPTQLAVLMQLCDYWWDSARKPFPSKESLAQRLGLSARQVQRHIADLEKAGLVTRIERRGSNGGKLTNTYDLSGLVSRLQELEPEFRAVEEENRKRREAVARPGLRSRAAAAAPPP
jgi:DNA-binding transcriptional ArsR family regulator